MASYWENDNKIQIKQTQVSVPSVNGLEYSGGQRVDIEIPSTIKFIDPQNSYINFDVKLKLPAGEVPTRLQLDDLTGGQSLFRNVRIYSNIGARVLLEEYQDYNVKVAMEYSYNQDDSIRNMRALREGATAHNLLTSGTHGTTTSQLQDTTTNPYFKRHQGTLDTDFSDDDFLTVKCCLPLRTGLWSGSKLIPNNLLGCYIEIDLESPQKVMKQLDSVNRWRRVDLCPTFWGTDAAGNTGIVNSDVANITEIFLGKDNGVVSLETCPFVVGEYINFCKREATNENCTPSWNSTGNNWADAKPVKIVSITMDGGYVKLTVEAFRLTAALSREIPNAEVGNGTALWIVYSATIDRYLKDETSGATFNITSYTPSYTVSNLEFIIAQVELDPQYEMGMMMKMREGGAIEMDFISCTNNKHNLLSSNRNATVDLNMNYSRAKSVIIVPTDASTYNSAQEINSQGTTYKVEQDNADGQNWNIYPQKGILDLCTQYQFLIGDRLEPSRPIKVSKFNLGHSIAAQPLSETEKALNQAMIPCRSFREYNRNFVIGKCFGLNDGVMNLQGQNVQLQLLYNEHTEAGLDMAPVKNKMLNCLSFHIRKLVIRQDSVSVIL
tara:strand:- start:687 stop:2513 length:1827 start_codon:yes stop_codon:yes gene_type:complete